MKRKFSLTFATLAVFCMSGISASAITPDDVANKARAAGWPETLIQEGYNAWSSGEYTEEDLQTAYDSVTTYDEKAKKMAENTLGIELPDIEPDTSAGGGVSSDGSSIGAIPSAGGGAAESPEEDNTWRIPSNDFIDMSLVEKQEYIDSLTPEQQQAFMQSMTTEERNSILKQLPAEEKAELVENLVDSASTMGVTVSVDDVSQENISVTMRNEDGVIIDKSVVGEVAIDETGIDYSGKWILAGVGALASVAGILWLYRCSRDES